MNNGMWYAATFTAVVITIWIIDNLGQLRARHSGWFWLMILLAGGYLGLLATTYLNA